MLRFTTAGTFIEVYGDVPPTNENETLEWATAASVDGFTMEFLKVVPA